MASTPEILTDIAARHQVHIERVKANKEKAFVAFLMKMDLDISKRLSGKNLTKFKKDRLESLLKKISDELNLIYAGFGEVIYGQAMELARYEAGFEIRSLNEIIDYDFTLPGIAQLNTAVFTIPLSVQGLDKGQLLKPFIKEWSGKTVKRVNGAIRSGFYSGQSTNEILRTIRGTRENRFKDGILAMANRDAAIMTRTALQHAANQARVSTWESNDKLITGYRIVVTFDSRTSKICQSEGQRREVYKVGAGPVPPLHIGCRSTTEAVLSDKYSFLDNDATRFTRGANGIQSVDADGGYYDWLKTQPQSFVRTAIKGKANADLFLKGGLTAERFAELSIGRNFEPLTLEQMRLLEPIAFNRAGI